VARALAAQPGAVVVAAARRAEDAADLASAGLLPLQLDVACAASRDTAPQQLRKLGVTSLRALVNNAGVYVHGWTREAFDACVRTNFTGAVELIRVLLPLLTPGAVIVNVSSGYGQLSHLRGSGYYERVASAPDLEALARIEFDPHDAHMASSYVPAYKLSKAMQNRATQLLAASPQLAARGVRVAAVSPGWVRTGMGRPDAPRSVEEGAAGILWLLRHDDESWPNGGFFQDGAPLPW
jgi:NAD(P)-dependent dehydrogenase (short-subunit alcohol dehydrogenase family)